jgi:hypothetical protein
MFCKNVLNAGRQYTERKYVQILLQLYFSYLADNNWDF